MAKYKQVSRKRRHHRVRKRVTGTDARARLAVFQSNKHISVQVIDDVSGRTLAAASTVEPGLRSAATSNKDAAASVGRLIAERVCVTFRSATTPPRSVCAARAVSRGRRAGGRPA